MGVSTGTSSAEEGPTRAEPSQRAAALRAQIRRQRASLSPSQRQDASNRISAALLARFDADVPVAGYMALASEPDIGAFLKAHYARGGQIYLPVIAEDVPRLLRWTRWAPTTPMRRQRNLPVMEPVGPRLELAEMVQSRSSSTLAMLVPSLAISTAGARLGQGGGFYDTTADRITTESLHQAVELIGICYAHEVLDPRRLQAQSHDLRVREVFTDDGHYDFR